MKPFTVFSTLAAIVIGCALLGGISSIKFGGSVRSTPHLEAHQSIIETTQDKKYYFVTYVGSEGVSLAPCIGSGCEPQGWSIERLQTTPHQLFHYGFAGYDEALSMFTRQTIPLCDDGSKPTDKDKCADGSTAIR